MWDKHEVTNALSFAGSKNIQLMKQQYFQNKYQNFLQTEVF